jgi:hypothetical protein
VSRCVIACPSRNLEFLKLCNRLTSLLLHLIVDSDKIYSRTLVNTYLQLNILAGRNVLKCIGDHMICIDCTLCTRIHFTIHSMYLKTYNVTNNIFKWTNYVFNAFEIFKNILGINQYIDCIEMVLKNQYGRHRYYKYISVSTIHWRIYVLSKYLPISAAVIFTDERAVASSPKEGWVNLVLRCTNLFTDSSDALAKFRVHSERLSSMVILFFGGGGNEWEDFFTFFVLFVMSRITCTRICAAKSQIFLAGMANAEDPTDH